VKEFAGMDLVARFLPDHHVVFIHHIENLRGFLRQVFERMHIAGPGEIHPLFEREFLRADGHRNLQICRDFLPWSARGQLLAELLAALGESAADQLIEQAPVECGQTRCPRAQNGHRRIDLRTRMKRLGRHRALRLHHPVHLRPQREYAIILGARFRRKARDHLLLQHHHRPLEGMRPVKRFFKIAPPHE
jgi:hypothetical protein